MSSIISIAVDPRLPAGVDWTTFDVFVAPMSCGENVEADLRARLKELDKHLHVGCEIAKRYWRLIDGQITKGLVTPRFDDACFDRVICHEVHNFHPTRQ